MTVNDIIKEPLGFTHIRVERRFIRRMPDGVPESDAEFHYFRIEGNQAVPCSHADFCKNMGFYALLVNYAGRLEPAYDGRRLYRTRYALLHSVMKQIGIELACGVQWAEKKEK